LRLGLRGGFTGVDKRNLGLLAISLAVHAVKRDARVQHVKDGNFDFDRETCGEFKLNEFAQFGEVWTRGRHQIDDRQYLLTQAKREILTDPNGALKLLGFDRQFPWAPNVAIV